MTTITEILDAEAEAVLATLPAAAELPSEDGIPMETPWHRAAMNLLIETLSYHWRDRNDCFVGGNMFIYFSLNQLKNRDYRGPGFFVVKGVDPNPRRGKWVVWEEDGRYPNVIVELVSRSTATLDRVEKKQLYEQTFSTPEFFCFDFVGGRFDAWRIAGGKYVPIEPNHGRYWSEELELYLGPWEGSFLGYDRIWPRFFTTEGTLVLTSSERAEAENHRAEAEKQRADAAEAELARLRTELESLKHSR